MKKTFFIYIYNLAIWIAWLVYYFLFFKNSMLQVSPWGMHNLENITLQIALIFLPLIGFISAFLTSNKIICIIILIINLYIVYFISFPLFVSWLQYFKLL